MEFINLLKIQYWLLIILVWMSFGTYLMLISFRLLFSNKNEKMFNSIKNFKSINPLYRIGINFVIAFLISFITTIVILRPTFGNEQTEISTKNLDIVFVVDISQSMNVFDVDDEKNRLDVAKEAIKKIVDEEDGNRYALISFHSKAYIDLPLTFDKNTINTGVDTLRIIDSYVSSGTSMYESLELSQERLINENDPNSQNRKKMIILVSDGEQVGTKVKELDPILSEIKKNNIYLYTLGVGTAEGGKIQVYQYNDGTLEYFKFEGREVISKLDEDNLTNIASKASGKYYYAGENFNPRNLIDDMQNSVQYSKVSSQIDVYRELYYIFTPMILILLILFHIEPYNFIVQLRKKQ